MQSLIDQQIIRRQKLQNQIQPVIEKHKQRVQEIREEIAEYMEMGGMPPNVPKNNLAQHRNGRDLDYLPEM